MSAACRRFPTPSTTRSRSWARPTSRCRTTTGVTGARRRTLEYLRNAHFNNFILRDASLRDAPQDEVSDPGARLRASQNEVLDPHGEERVFARLEPWRPRKKWQ